MSNLLPSTIKKILIVRLGALGDIVHAMPVQQRIHSSFPEAEIHWLTEKPFVPLIEALPGVHRVWSAGLRDWSFRTSPARLSRLIAGLRKEELDATLDFQGLVKSAILARLSGARATIGFAAGYTRERLAPLFYTVRVPLPDKLHVVELNLRLAAQIGCSTNGDGRVPLAIPVTAQEKISRQLSENSLERPVVVNPGAGWVTKLWPAANYAQLAARIENQLGFPVVFTFGPGEEPIIDEVRRHSAHRVFSFSTTLLELAALCQQARLIVAGDTGPLHLAVALGTPAVAIMGPSSSWRNGPFSSSDLVVQRHLPCSDCYKRTCNQFICMDISVDEVFHAVSTRLGL